jgi:hypothetical protein
MTKEEYNKTRAEFDIKLREIRSVLKMLTAYPSNCGVYEATRRVEYLENLYEKLSLYKET